MTNEIFVERTYAFFNEDCLPTMNAKGIDYSGKEDKFANFKREGKKLDLPATTIWHVYFCKHLDSIETYIKNVQKHGIAYAESQTSEPISGRIKDAINYLFILKGMIDELREEYENAKEV